MAHFVPYYCNTRARARLCRTGCTHVPLDLSVPSLPSGTTGGNEELRDKLNGRRQQGPSFASMGNEGLIHRPGICWLHSASLSPPMGWGTPPGLPQAAPINPKRLAAGLLCVSHHLEDQTEDGDLHKQVRAVTGPLLDLFSFRERKFHREGSTWKHHHHPLLQGTGSDGWCCLAADVTSCCSEVTSMRTPEQTGTVVLPGLCHDGPRSAAALLLRSRGPAQGVPLGPLLCRVSVSSEENKVVHPPALLCSAELNWDWARLSDSCSTTLNLKWAGRQEICGC